MPDTIGFIGLGIMGRPMVKNLLKAGFSVVGFNRSRPGLDDVLAAGAAEGKSPADVAARSDIVITMVPDTPDVRAAVFGKNGAAEGLSKGKLLVDMSTISPGQTRQMAAELAAKTGAEWVDAPVSGGDIGAIKGTLSIMVGGSEAAFARCRGPFEAMGKNIVHMGPAGSGQATKLVNQTLCAVNLLAVCEALVLGARSGLDLTKLIKAVEAGAAGSWALSNLGPRMIARNWAPGFMVKLQQKDLRLVLAAAEEGRVPMPGTALVHQLLVAVQAEPGGDEQGTAALVRALEKTAGVTVGGQAGKG
jgi:3-hydroxyisobutyrate dehydrogenase